MREVHKIEVWKERMAVPIWLEARKCADAAPGCLPSQRRTLFVASGCVKA